MEKRTLDELITYFNQMLSALDIAQEYKLKIAGMVIAIVHEAIHGKWGNDGRNDINT